MTATTTNDNIAKLTYTHSTVEASTSKWKPTTFPSTMDSRISADEESNLKHLTRQQTPEQRGIELSMISQSTSHLLRQLPATMLSRGTDIGDPLRQTSSDNSTSYSYPLAPKISPQQYGQAITWFVKLALCCKISPQQYGQDIAWFVKPALCCLEL